MVDCVICATGPSFEPNQVRWNDADLIAVNNAYTVLPGGILYACDGEWWDHHNSSVDHSVWDCWTTNHAAAKMYDLNHVHGCQQENSDLPFQTDIKKGIVYGMNSGFQALNLAYHLRYRDVVLLGFDMGHAPGQQSHFFGEHPQKLIKPSPYDSFIYQFNRAAMTIKAAGMRVRNATPGSRLKCFEEYDDETN